MRDKMTLDEFHDKFEGKDVMPSLEDGHSGKHIVGIHEHVNKKEKVKRIDSTGKRDV